MNLTQTVEWIPCSERMPKIHRRVLIWTGERAEHAYLTKARWSTHSGDYAHRIIEFWAKPLRGPSDL